MAELRTVLALSKSAANALVPVVSIGMPVYNGEKYISEALDSLLKQTFTDFELIISDNGSFDSTQAICEDYVRRDSRVRYFRQIANKGAVDNFRFVLDQAKSKLFMWAAHDDLWAPDYLKDAMALLMRDGIDFVFPAFELRSTRFGIAKRIDPETFKFIESSDRRWRVLHFMALHYLSHSANIVYSLFRTNFLRSAWASQDISNDGVLGAVVLSRGRGVTGNALFSKRYSTVWPGTLSLGLGIVRGWLHGNDVIDESRQAIQVAQTRMLDLFPEYEREITFIFERYHPCSYGRDYQACSIDELF
jgi:glycosyltransferase involved in cell wall biosynthesis